MPSRRRTCARLALLGLALPALGALAGGLGPRAARGGEPDVVDAYVGAQVCQNCHQAQHALWTGSSHFHTFERAAPGNVPPEVRAGGTVEHPPGRTAFRVEGGRYLAETVGPDGSPATYPLTHVVGRMRVKMFVTTLDDGRQQVLPAMLEEPTGRWFDYTHLIFGAGGTEWSTPPVVRPGDDSFWTGAVRSWDARCARCHVSGWEFRRPGPDGRGPRYRMRQPGVDCEMCHGPGAEHVDFRESKREGQDPMPAYRDLSHRAALGMCLQCHMESEVVDEDYVLGKDIFEHRDPTLLVDPERIDPAGRSLELIYDGTPFSVSRCVAEGKLTCVTCHQPHGSSLPSQMRRDPGDDANCTECHAAIGKEPAAHTHHAATGSGARCVSCHMPFLEIERGHGVVADHTISIPTYDLRGDRVAQTACSWCHQAGLGAPGDAPKLEDARLRQAHAAWYGARGRPAPWMQALGAARAGDPDGAQGLVRVLEDRRNARLVRATAAELLGRYAERAPLALLAYARDEDSLVRRRALASLAGLRGQAVDDALLRGLQDPSRAVQVAAARAALEGWSRVQQNPGLLQAILPVLQSDAETGPEDDMRWFRLGAARSLGGDDAGALAAYERVLELDPHAENVRRSAEEIRARLQPKPAR